MADETINCVEPVRQAAPEAVDEAASPSNEKRIEMTVARAGAQAPDFAGMAYYAGGFKQVKLSDYAGKWTVICFYPGDFTFV